MSHEGEAALAGCVGKVRFDSHAAASRIQKRRGKKGGDNRDARMGQVYRCRFCHGYHIGRRADQDRPKHEWKRYKRRYEDSYA